MHVLLAATAGRAAAAAVAARSGVCGVAATRAATWQNVRRFTSLARCAAGSGRHRTPPHWFGSIIAAAAAAVAASGAALLEADDVWDALPVPPQSPLPAQAEPTARKRPGHRFDSLSDMIEDVFPSLCKIQGVVGDRECDNKQPLPPPLG
jgi:hypothetical protein